jgi:hypothetical protein
MPFLPAGVGAAIAGGVASAGVGLVGSQLMKGSVDKSSGQAVQVQQQGLEQSRADLEPWRTAGQTAIPAVSNAAGLNGQEGYDAAMAGFHTSPGYQFALDEGIRALDHGAAAKGILNSGDTIKAEMRYGKGLADQDFGTYYNRLWDLSKLGESAAAGSASTTADASKGIAQTDLSQGSATSSIYGNAAKGIGDIAGNTANSIYGKINALMDPSWASLNRTNPTVAPNTWSSQPDSYYLPGGGGYQI